MIQGTITGTTVIINITNITNIKRISITNKMEKPRRMIMSIKAQGEQEQEEQQILWHINRQVLEQRPGLRLFQVRSLLPLQAYHSTRARTLTFPRSCQRHS